MAPDSLETYIPPVANDFGVLVLAEIGPADDDRGADGFYVTVCSPNWLARMALEENDKGFEFIHHQLVVDRWDPVLFQRAIQDLCYSTTGEDWDEVATKLSRYLAWEFEDYTEG